MATFVTNCYGNLGGGGWGVIVLLLCNREMFLKYTISCYNPKFELKIQRCLCLYVSSILYLYMKFFQLVNVLN